MPEIDVIYAYIAEEYPGEEGITAFMGPMGWMPMIGADEARVLSLRDMAQETANSSGRPVKLVRFETRTEVDVIMPDGPGHSTVIHNPKETP